VTTCVKNTFSMISCIQCRHTITYCFFSSTWKHILPAVFFYCHVVNLLASGCFKLVVSGSTYGELFNGRPYIPLFQGSWCSTVSIWLWSVIHKLQVFIVGDNTDSCACANHHYHSNHSQQCRQLYF